MKIAYINADPDVPVFGASGSSVHVQEVVLALLKRGDEVHLFATRLGDQTANDLTSLHIHPMPRVARKDNSPAGLERAALDNNETLHRALTREHEQSPFDLIYERHSLWNCAGMDFAAEHQLPSVLEVNAPLLEEQTARHALVNRNIAEDVTMRVFRAASVITVVSKELGHLIEQHPSARGKIHVVPNAVRPERFLQAEPTLPKLGRFVIGFVGELRAVHGFTTLINSFAAFAQQSYDANLLIVGDGPAREELHRELASRDLLGRVRFTGAVTPEAIPGLLASMDVAVAPYPPLAHFYSSPIKVYEYMAAGLPIVASRIGQVGEIIQDGVTGLLVGPGDSASFTKALIRLQSDAQLREQLGAGARESVSEHTWDRIVDHILALVEANAQVPTPG